MPIIATKQTFDGVRYSLHEDTRGALAIVDGGGIVPTRNYLSATAWLAVWGDLEIITSDELPGALRRASTADRDGRDVREAIHAPAIKAEHERQRAAAHPHVCRWINGVLVVE